MKDPALLARSVLADPRFRPHGVAPQHSTSLLERTVDWLRATWQHLIENVARQVHVSPGATNIAGELLLSALVTGIIAVIVRLLLSISRETVSASVTLLETAPAQTSAELWAQANGLADRGHHAKAVVALYRATLALLSERQLLADSASLTAGEVERLLRRRDRTVHDSFTAIAQRFNKAAYAGAALDVTQWDAAAHSYARLTQPETRDA